MTTETKTTASKPLGPIARVLYSVIRAAILGGAKLLGRVEVHGADNVPAGAFVLAPVHRSNIDFGLASLVTTRRLRYMAKDSLWKSKPLGNFVSFLGAFPVSRGAADREALRTCIDVIEAGEPLVMFPEGTRRSGPVIEELFDGPAYVAAKTQVPIVPVGIGGSEAMMPKGSKLLKPSKLVIVIGEPLEPPAPSESGRVSRRAIKQLTDQLRAEVQKLFDDAQSRAGR
ncbi:MAG TPA: lysophospholipid acyltransferase family protein [Acidimicrobiales bacterium]|jgi:1-acyl-sn-glycerol-3-phosphate acyltransferase|nr:lysophospholipid acyltransferase family protein [Acidimicrobiales bacterium]